MALLRVAAALWMTTPAILGLVACSDPLVDTTYRGEPLFTVRGQVLQLENTPLTDDPVRVALFWSPSGRTDVDPTDLVEQPSVSVGIDFPSAFALHVFQPPGRRHLTDGGYGVGVVLVYQDRDRDGAYSAGELVGGASERAVLYADEPVSASQSPSSKALDEGYQLLRLPNGCGQAIQCTIPLGTPCTDESQCGGGVCFPDPEFPGGYCALLSADAFCVPDGAVAIYWSVVEDVVFADACDGNEECRTAEGYECSSELGACVPTALMEVEAGCDTRDGDACFDDSVCGFDGYCELFSFEEPGFCASNCEAFGDDDSFATVIGTTCDGDGDCDTGTICDPSLRLCLPDKPVSIDIRSDFAMQPLCAGGD